VEQSVEENVWGEKSHFTNLRIQIQNEYLKKIEKFQIFFLSLNRKKQKVYLPVNDIRRRMILIIGSGHRNDSSRLG